LGRALIELGRFEEAETLLLSVREALRERPDTAATVTKRLIELYDAWGKVVEADEWRQVHNAESGS
jgi:hypothetical protein